MKLRSCAVAAAAWLACVTVPPPVFAQRSVGVPGMPQGAPPPRYNPAASVRLQVTPREAQVFVDGYYAGIVDDFDGTFQRLDLEAGQHDLTLFLPGYRLHTEQVYLQPGNTFKVRYTMERLPPGEAAPQRPTGTPRPPNPPPLAGPQGTNAPPSGTQPPSPADAPPAGSRTEGESPVDRSGSLTISVQPADAEILVDGEHWDNQGNTDRLVIYLAPGQHTVQVQKTGYRGYLTEVTVKANEKTPLNVSLSAER